MFLPFSATTWYHAHIILSKKNRWVDLHNETCTWGQENSSQNRLSQNVLRISYFFEWHLLQLHLQSEGTTLKTRGVMLHGVRAFVGQLLSNFFFFSIFFFLKIFFLQKKNFSEKKKKKKLKIWKSGKIKALRVRELTPAIVTLFWIWLAEIGAGDVIDKICDSENVLRKFIFGLPERARVFPRYDPGHHVSFFIADTNDITWWICFLSVVQSFNMLLTRSVYWKYHLSNPTWRYHSFLTYFAGSSAPSIWPATMFRFLSLIPTISLSESAFYR